MSVREECIQACINAFLKFWDLSCTEVLFQGLQVMLDV